MFQNIFFSAPAARYRQKETAIIYYIDCKLIGDDERWKGTLIKLTINEYNQETTMLRPLGSDSACTDRRSASGISRQSHYDQ